MEWASEQARIHIADPLPLRAGVGGTRPRMENDVDRPRVVSAHAGDHALVYALLRSVNQSPAHDDFINWLDEPSYLPVDRLLVKKREQILAHAQVLHRAAWFQGIKLPVAGLRDVVVLPEYERTGCLQMLIHAACEAMHAGGAVISLVRTEQPELLVPYGWSEVRAPGYSRASVGDLLAYLSMHKRRSELAHRSRAATRFAGPFRRRCRPLRVRLWRHVELSALRAVYDESFVNGWGGLCRTDAYWQWLIGRNAHSDLIVAVEGEAPSNDSTADTHIVGYAVTRGSQVLELCCRARVCPRGPAIVGPRLPGSDRARPAYDFTPHIRQRSVA
jgi:GNAT superfamily N-acetyltransferase